jgi:hypothetical protein
MSWAKEDEHMTAINPSLEERVTALEHEMREVKSQLKALSELSQRPWWERLAGTFKDDSLFDEIIKAGHAYRRSLMPQTRWCFILDTDHLTIIQRQSEPAYSRLAPRLREFSSGEICTTIVNFEEQMRVWLAVIVCSRRTKSGHKRLAQWGAPDET